MAIIYGWLSTESPYMGLIRLLQLMGLTVHLSDVMMDHSHMEEIQNRAFPYMEIQYRTFRYIEIQNISVMSQWSIPIYGDSVNLHIRASLSHRDITEIMVIPC